jgi:hypothetical protein
MSNLGNYSGVTINTVAISAGGAEKESVDSIKFNAPKAYSSHGRAVTKDDYINIIKNSTTIVPIESVSVWGGDEEVPQILGKMFIAIKPTGGYTITQSQKDRLLNEVIKPISIITVIPEIVDINYTYIRINSNILFNKSNSIISPDYLIQLTKAVIIDFTNTTLNKFNSTFVLPDLIYAIRKIDSSVVSVDAEILAEKYLTPTLNTNNTYTLKFGFPIKRDFLNGSIESSPYSTYIQSLNTIVNNVKIEGSPTILNSISSIDVQFPGSGYITTPNIVILGDGSGATAKAIISNGRLSSIVMLTEGSNYTQVVVKITGGGGSGAAAIPNLSGSIINLRNYYFSGGVKTIISENIGTLNFNTGEINIYEFNPSSLNDPLGIFAITVKPNTTIIKSERDSIVTLNSFNPLSINTTLSIV